MKVLPIEILEHIILHIDNPITFKHLSETSKFLHEITASEHTLEKIKTKFSKVVIDEDIYTTREYQVLPNGVRHGYYRAVDPHSNTYDDGQYKMGKQYGLWTTKKYISKEVYEHDQITGSVCVRNEGSYVTIRSINYD